MKKIENVLTKIFRLAGRVQCEVLAERRDDALTRFADNVVSQNVGSCSLGYSVRLLDNGRSAKVNFNQDDDASLKRAVLSGLEILRRQKKDPSLMPLAKAAKLQAGRCLYSEETAGLTPSFRAERAAELARACKRAGQVAYGTVENVASDLVIANNLGVFARHRETYAAHSVTVRHGDGFGWAERSSFDVKEIPFGELNETARSKAAASRRPRDPKPGKYTVILEPHAAADLLAFLCAYGFGGQLYNEGRSFACGRLGKKTLSPLLTITDDAVSGPAAGMPFDYEGQPRSRVTLVENGVLRSVVHDRKTAKKAGARPTGHALPVPSYFGPMPLNMAVKPGEGSLQDLIRGTERGILVTQFHYTNLLKAQTVEMTGMTRNGTFMVENGRISYPIKNMRFTQGMVEAFSNIEAVGGEPLTMQVWGSMSCPAMRLSGFNFSSATKF